MLYPHRTLRHLWTTASSFFWETTKNRQDKDCRKEASWESWSRRRAESREGKKSCPKISIKNSGLY